MMSTLSRGRVTILWLAVAILLFMASGSAWRDLVSSPAGTIVHVSVRGSELVPLIKALALFAILIAIVSIFANRLVISVLSAVVGIFALATLVSTLGKLGVGATQAGVSPHFYWIPAAVGLVGTMGAIALALCTPLSAKSWAVARYRASEKKEGVAPLDLWRAQDAGIDPTVSDD